jgi:hypothetical protein
MARTFTIVCGCVLGSIGVALGAWAASLEMAPATLGYTSLQRVANMQSPQSLAGLSALTGNQALLDCTNALHALQSIEAQYMSEAQRDSIVPNCERLADHIIGETPVHSYALYVRALAASTQSDWSAMNADLALSTRSGPSEQWIGEQRALLAARFLDKLEPQTVETNDSDLAMLVQSSRGVRAIAALYISNQPFREHLTQLVEKLPPEDQRRFVNNVRRAAQERQGSGS